jgi:hypothetical protein
MPKTRQSQSSYSSSLETSTMETKQLDTALSQVNLTKQEQIAVLQAQLAEIMSPGVQPAGLERAAEEAAPATATTTTTTTTTTTAEVSVVHVAAAATPEPAAPAAATATPTAAGQPAPMVAGSSFAKIQFPPEYISNHLYEAFHNSGFVFDVLSDGQVEFDATTLEACVLPPFPDKLLSKESWYIFWMYWYCKKDGWPTGHLSICDDPLGALALDNLPMCYNAHDFTDQVKSRKSTIKKCHREDGCKSQRNIKRRPHDAAKAPDPSSAKKPFEGAKAQFCADEPPVICTKVPPKRNGILKGFWVFETPTGSTFEIEHAQMRKTDFPSHYPVGAPQPKRKYNQLLSQSNRAHLQQPLARLAKKTKQAVSDDDAAAAADVTCASNAAVAAAAESNEGNKAPKGPRKRQGKFNPACPESIRTAKAKAQVLVLTAAAAKTAKVIGCNPGHATAASACELATPKAAKAAGESKLTAPGASDRSLAPTAGVKMEVSATKSKGSSSPLSTNALVGGFTSLADQIGFVKGSVAEKDRSDAAAAKVDARIAVVVATKAKQKSKSNLKPPASMTMEQMRTELAKYSSVDSTKLVGLKKAELISKVQEARVLLESSTTETEPKSKCQPKSKSNGGGRGGGAGGGDGGGSKGRQGKQTVTILAATPTGMQSPSVPEQPTSPPLTPLMPSPGVSPGYDANANKTANGNKSTPADEQPEPRMQSPSVPEQPESMDIEVADRPTSPGYDANANKTANGNKTAVPPMGRGAGRWVVPCM